MLNETFSAHADERALILGIAQAMGAAFNAWIPLLIFSTATQAPLFRVGYTTVSILGGLQALGVLALAWVGKKVVQNSALED